MVEIEFIYKGEPVLIQCNKDEKCSAAFQKFYGKTLLNPKSLVFLYSGDAVNIESNLSEIMNEHDKTTNKMIILVNQIDDEDEEQKKEILVKSKDIICPICKNVCKINIEDYKISLYGCKNNHKVDNILIDEFEELQEIDISKIKCDLCTVKNKGNSYDNEFFICAECNKQLH